MSCIAAIRLLLTLAVLKLGIAGVLAQKREDCLNFDLADELELESIDPTIAWLEARSVKPGGFLDRSSLESYCLVFGVPVFGMKGVDHETVETLSTVFAEFIDNDEDGWADVDGLNKSLRKSSSTLVITKTEEQKRSFFQRVHVANCAPAHKLKGLITFFEAEDKVRNPGAPGDASLGLIADFIVDFGYPHAYDPERNFIARKIDEYYPQAIEEGWLRTEILGPGAGSHRREYQKWLIKSAMGVDVEECEYWGIWTLCDPKKLSEVAPVLYQTMKQSLVTPNGRYDSVSRMDNK